MYNILNLNRMTTVNPVILNNRLKWDGTHLGSYWKALTGKWTVEGIQYGRITLPSGWSEKSGNSGNFTELPSGVIYCIIVKAKDSFPCIVEDIKAIFGLPRSGLHRINVDYQEYFIYYVPLSTSGELVWETPLNRLDGKHLLRKDPAFRKEVQKIIVFSDILALGRTGEPAIRIRSGSNGTYIPISMNENSTLIPKAVEYDYSIISKTLFLKWFGEETSTSDVVKDIVYAGSMTQETMDQRTDINNLAVTVSEIRNKVDTVIKRYDSNYIWYSNFIIDRMSRYLLMGQ